MSDKATDAAAAPVVDPALVKPKKKTVYEDEEDEISLGSEDSEDDEDDEDEEEDDYSEGDDSDGDDGIDSLQSKYPYSRLLLTGSLFSDHAPRNYRDQLVRTVPSMAAQAAIEVDTVDCQENDACCQRRGPPLLRRIQRLQLVLEQLEWCFVAEGDPA